MSRPFVTLRAASLLILSAILLTLGPNSLSSSAQELSLTETQTETFLPIPSQTETPNPASDTPLPISSELTPTETPVSSETPQDTPTELPLTITLAPSATDTVTATATWSEITPEVTATATEMPADVATATATLEAPISALTSAVTVLTGGNNYFLQVDLQDPRVDFRVGLANNDAGGYETLASMKNRYAGQGHAEWAVINGDYFGSGCLSNVNCAQGLTYINGVKRDNWSAYGTTWPVRGNLGFDSSNGVQIAIGDGQTKRFMTIAGGPWIVKDGGPPTCDAQYINGTTYFSTGEQFTGDQRSYCTTTAAITMVGYSADRRYLYMGVSSGGMTVLQLAQWLKDRGAYDVLKLDGGGSSGIYHNGTLMRGSGSRAIANHLALIVSNDTCSPNADQVSLYTDPNYGGTCVTKGIGDYPNPGSLGIANDSVSSIKVGGNVQIVLCRDDNYSSTCETFTGDDPNLGDNSIGDNQVSSAKVQTRPSGGCNPNADQVALYTDSNYGGSCVTKGIGDYPNPGSLGIANDSVSSIKVGENVQVRVCRDDNYSSTCEVFTGDDANLVDNSIGDNQISSAKVEARSTGYPVTLYIDSNYGGGWCAITGAGWVNVCDGYNDNASSIEVQAGWSARVWEHSDRGGASRCFSGDTSNLAGLQFNENGSGNLDNAISSFAAYNQSGCPPLIPDMPSDFRVSGSTESSITIAWDDVANESGYKIYKWDWVSSFVYYASVGANATSYTDPNLQCGSYAYYEVSAYNSSGESPHAGWVQGSTQACPNPPILSDPGDNAVLGNRTVNFTWQSPNSLGQTGYVLRLSQSSNPNTSPWLVNTSLGNEVLNYTHTFANDGTFYWHMQTIGGSGNSSWVTHSVIVDTGLPSLTITNPVENGFLNSNEVVIQVSPSDSISGVSEVQFFVGYDASITGTGLDNVGANDLNEITPPTPILEDVDPLEMNAQAWDWHYLITDVNSTDGWTTIWDASTVADQNIAFYAFAFDHAGNYQGTGIGNILLDRVAPSCAVNPLAANSSSLFTVSWSGNDATSGVASYSVQSQDNGGNWTDWRTNTTLTSSTFTGLSDHVYAFRCRAQDRASNLGSWPSSADTQTTVVTSPATAPVLVSPSNSSILNDNTPTLEWSAVGSYTRYRVQIDNNSIFSSPDQDATVDALTYTATTLPEGSYYWRVQALNLANTAGPWSAARVFTIDTTPPGVPTLSAPADTATLTTARPTFSWLAVTGANRYRLQVSTVAGFSATVMDNEGATTSYAATISLIQGTYYWRVQARDAAGNWGEFSNPRTFNLNILSAPTNNFVTTSTRPTFQWYSVIGATQYEWQLASDTNFTSIASSYITPNGATLSYIPPVTTPLAYGIYYWRVNVDLGSGLDSSPFYRTITITPPAPVAPTLISPNSGALTNNNAPTFTWNALTVAGSPFSYEIQVDNNSNFSSPEFTATDAATSAISGVLSDGLYYWRVRAINFLNVSGSWSAARTLTVDTVAPPAPNLTSPANNSGTNKAKPAFSWAAVSGANLYRIQVSSDANFGIQVIDTTAATTTYTAGVALNGGVYYWHVQARDAAGNWSAWSTTYTFDITILRAPVDGAFTTDTTPTFQWYTVTGAVRYELQVSADLDFTTLALDYISPNGLTASYTSPNTAPLGYGLYYWRVNIDKGSGFELSPVSWQVTITPNPPVAPILVSPSNNVTTNDNTPGFSWNSVTDALTYQIQIDNNSTFASPEQNTTVGSADYTASTLVDGLYYWRVRALNYLNVPGAWSPARTFTVDTMAPATPVLTTPTNGAISTTVKPAFSWGAVIGGSRYEMQLGTTNPPIVTVVSANIRTYTPPGPLLLTTYYWRVRAVDAAGNTSAWSELRSIVIPSPTNDAPRLNRFTTSTPTLTWGLITWAAGYEVQVDNNSNFSSPEYTNSTIPAGTLSDTTSALPNGTWYWRIRARNSAGTAGPWSTMGSFTIES